MPTPGLLLSVPPWYCSVDQDELGSSSTTARTWALCSAPSPGGGSKSCAPSWRSETTRRPGGGLAPGRWRVPPCVRSASSQTPTAARTRGGEIAKGGGNLGVGSHGSRRRVRGGSVRSTAVASPVACPLRDV